MRFGTVVLALALFGASLGVADTAGGTSAAATGATISNYKKPNIKGPSSITAGPDGALWFTNSNNAIGRISTAGVVTRYTDPSIASPAAITTGPDGALWFTNFNNSSIGRITTAGKVTKFTDSSIASPLGITSGPDGALWFINAGGVNTGGIKTNGSIGRITTTGVVTNYTDQSILDPISIAAGSDGALWFTNFRVAGDDRHGSIGRITTSGAVTNFKHPNIVNPISIASSGCVGALWFTNGDNSIGLIEPPGTKIFSITDASVSDPDGIVAGPGCDVWFTNQSNNSIGYIKPDPKKPGGWIFSRFTNSTISLPVGITMGPDNALWFSNFTGDSIGRITQTGQRKQASARAPRAAGAVPVAGPSVNAYAATPTARVGAFYFDGWSGPLSNFHFQGLTRPGPLGGPPNGQFPERRPLYGWRDDTVESMRTQLAWARQAGISFFAFDWFNYPFDPKDPINGALGSYLKLKDHNGVGFALNYIAQNQFGVPLDKLPAIAEKWVTQYFLNPNYVRINGKPLLTVTEILDTVRLWGDPDGINQGIQIIQNAAKKHGLPGVYIVGLRADYQQYCEGVVLDCLGEDGHQSQQHWDAISKFQINQVVAPADGPTPYSRVISQEKQVNWPAWAEQTTFPYIPSLGLGWDERQTGGQINDSNSLGHMFWFVRSPIEVGQFLKDAVSFAKTHPQLHVSSTPGAPPFIFMQSWNELGEGAYLVPTIGDGYTYTQAVAKALGLPWNTTHARKFASTKVAGTQLTGTLTVPDHWSPCDLDAVVLQRKAGAGFATAAKTTTKPGGAFTFKLAGSGSYRVVAAKSTKYQQTCAAATSSLLAAR